MSADMLRKLILVGMLTLVEQGSTVQICTAQVTSFAFFSAHVRMLPYRHMEDNVLRTTTEIHLFVILVMVLAFKSSMDETVKENYDIAATVLFIVFVPVFFILCLAHKWRSVMADDVETSALTTHTARLQAAFRRQLLGRDKDVRAQLAHLNFKF